MHVCMHQEKTDILGRIHYYCELISKVAGDSNMHKCLKVVVAASMMKMYGVPQSYSWTNSKPEASFFNTLTYPRAHTCRLSIAMHNIPSELI